jgi:hypothetical protein
MYTYTHADLPLSIVSAQVIDAIRRDGEECIRESMGNRSFIQPLTRTATTNILSFAQKFDTFHTHTRQNIDTKPDLSDICVGFNEPLCQ